MTLSRKVRRVGSSLIITIPSQLAEIYEIFEGNEINIIPVEKGKFILQKSKETVQLTAKRIDDMTREKLLKEIEEKVSKETIENKDKNF